MSNTTTTTETTTAKQPFIDARVLHACDVARTRRHCVGCGVMTGTRTKMLAEFPGEIRLIAIPTCPLCRQSKPDTFNRLMVKVLTTDPSDFPQLTVKGAYTIDYAYRAWQNGYRHVHFPDKALSRI